MLDVAEASARTGMSRDWLYRKKDSLPFARRIGRKVLFSEAGLTRWLARR
jgi:excisionase family DNA binding protein